MRCQSGTLATPYVSCHRPPLHDDDDDDNDEDDDDNGVDVDWLRVMICDIYRMTRAKPCMINIYKLILCKSAVVPILRLVMVAFPLLVLC